MKISAMPETEEVPRGEWIGYLDVLTRNHQGEPVTVEVLDGKEGAQVEASNLSLQGISADVKRSGEHDVNIILGAERNPPLTRMIPEARHIRVERGDRGLDEALEIEAADGSKTLVRFRMPRAA
jgi:hypothetical protein